VMRGFDWIVYLCGIILLVLLIVFLFDRVA
jgi:uncharacterized integral membrane protein